MFGWFRARSRRSVRYAGGAAIPVGRAERRYLGGREMIIAHLDSGFVAATALCTHWPELIDPASLKGCEVRCPIHWATFDLRTGRATSGPTRRPIETYPVRVAGDDLLIDLED